MPPAIGRFPPASIPAGFSHVNHSHSNSHISHSNPPMQNQSLSSHYAPLGPPLYSQNSGPNVPVQSHSNIPTNMSGHSGIPRNYPHGMAMQNQLLHHSHPHHSSHHTAQTHPTHVQQQPHHGLSNPAHQPPHSQGPHASSMSHLQQIQQQQLQALQSAQSHTQSQPQTLDPSSLPSGTLKNSHGRTREVWKDNLVQEMHLLRYLVERYPYISMDTEFPGVVARPMGDFSSKAGYHYQTLRCNVDLLKIIQLGITLFSPAGDLPPIQLEESGLAQTSTLSVCPCTWTFNFKFSVESDMSNQDSIDMLRKAGADFDKHSELGIDPAEFGSLLITSGLVLSDDVHWISFHSGYDFAYLVKLMWCKQLPDDETHYRRLADIFFPRLLDVKFMLRHIQRLVARGAVLNQEVARTIANLGSKSALQDLADELGCHRIGAQHTAGSDAWLTGLVFWQMKNKMFDDQIPDELNGQIWGITGVGVPAGNSAFSQLLMSGQLPQSHVIGNGQKTQGQDTDGPTTPTSASAGMTMATPNGNTLVQSSGNGTPSSFGNFQYTK